MSRHGLSKSQESAVAHRERGKQDEGHDAQPDPPSTAHHSSISLLIFKAFRSHKTVVRWTVVLKPTAMPPRRSLIAKYVGLTSQLDFFPWYFSLSLCTIYYKLFPYCT